MNAIRTLLLMPAQSMIEIRRGYDPKRLESAAPAAALWSLAIRASIVVGVACLLSLSPAGAQSPRPRSGEILPYLVATDRFACRIVGGQITVSCQQAFSTRSQSNPPPERVSLRPTEDGAIVDYELKKSDEHIIFEVRGPASVRLRREVGEPGKLEVVELVQGQGGRVKLTVGYAGKIQTCEAPGFWHLLVAERDLCRRSLYPLMSRIRKDWGFDEKLDAIEEELLRLGSASGVADRQRWTALVRQLADDRFGRREAAERELRAAGPAVRGFLEQLDFDHLEAEQQARIRRILQEAPGDGNEDSPALAAGTLLDSPLVWLGMLSRAEPETRRAAAAQLSRLLAAPIQFDAEAEPAVRQRQIDALRARIATIAPQR